MFFATPHRNSDQTVSMLKRIAFRGLGSNFYIEALQREVDSVANLNSEFRQQLSRYQVFNFCETRKSYFGRKSYDVSSDGSFEQGLVKAKLDSNKKVIIDT